MDVRARVIVSIFVLLGPILHAEPKANLCDVQQLGPGNSCTVSDEQFLNWRKSGRLFNNRALRGGNESTDSIWKAAGKLGSDMFEILSFANKNSSINADIANIASLPKASEPQIDKQTPALNKEMVVSAFSNSIRETRKITFKVNINTNNNPNLVPATCNLAIKDYPRTCESANDRGWDSLSSEAHELAAAQSIVSRYNFPLKKSLSCIKNQGKRQTCISFAFIGAIETKIAFDTNQFVNLSEQSLTYQTKEEWDDTWYKTEGYDAGFLAQDLISGNHRGQQTLKHYVIPLEKKWDYNPSHCQSTDTDKNLKDSCINTCNNNLAKKLGLYDQYCSNAPSQGLHVIDSSQNQGYLSKIDSSDTGAMLIGYEGLWYQDKEIEIERTIDRLNHGVPVVVSLNLTSAFTPENPGVIPNPRSGEPLLGGHAVIIVGFVPFSQLEGFDFKAWAPSNPKPTQGMFILKNSWGISAGDSGFFYVSDEYIRNYAYQIIAISNVNYKNLEG